MSAGDRTLPPRLGFVEIPARDADRLARFLNVVFSWSTTRRDWSAGTYLAVEDAGGDIGCGLVESRATGLTGPTPVIHVEPRSIEDYLDRIESAGGKIVEARRPVDRLGFFARFADTESNVWGLWEPVSDD